MLAGVISIAAYIPFVIAIISKRKQEVRPKPNRASWTIWGFVSGMIYLSYHATGAESTVYVPLCYMIGSSIIAILSFPYGVGGWTKLDRACLVTAGISGLAWIVLLQMGYGSAAPLIVLFLNMGIDAIGAIPTIKKVYLEPESEDKLTWVLFLLGSIVNVFAIEQWTFTIVFYPMLMLVLIALITGLMIFRPHKPT